MTNDKGASPSAGAKPRCEKEGHESSVVLCQVIEPDTLITDAKFYFCTASGCHLVWNEEGAPMDREA